MGVKYNHIRLEQENSKVVAQNIRRKWRTKISKFVENGQKMPFFSCFWVPRMFVDGGHLHWNQSG